jgi:hypothetical protein
MCCARATVAGRDDETVALCLVDLAVFALIVNPLLFSHDARGRHPEAIYLCYVLCQSCCLVERMRMVRPTYLVFYCSAQRKVQDRSPCAQAKSTMCSAARRWHVDSRALCFLQCPLVCACNQLSLPNQLCKAPTPPLFKAYVFVRVCNFNAWICSIVGVKR